MTRKPKKKTPSSRAPRRTASVLVKPRKAARSEPLDDFIAASAAALGLKIEKSWMPTVRSNLEVTLKLGALVSQMAPPDDADPAPVFKA